jgi:hypothetical protein
MLANLCGRGDKDIFTVAEALGVDGTDVTRLSAHSRAYAPKGRRARLLRHRPIRPRDTAANLDALVEGGADVIELGMPFTDPMADGPAIQLANLRSLGAGTKTADILAHRGRVPRSAIRKRRWS